MKKYEVSLYPRIGNEQIASAIVEAADFDSARKKAIALMRIQYPQVDPERYDHLIAIETLWATTIVE